MTLSRGTNRFGESRESFGPRVFKCGGRELGQEELDNPVQQVGLVDHMAIERHWGNPEPFSDCTHGERLQAQIVGDGQPSREDAVSVNTRWTSHRS